MTSLFVPPKPRPLPQKASVWQRLSIGLRSGLSLFLGGSYTDLGVGRHRVPTLPYFRMRELFTVRDPDLIREVLVRRSEEFPKSGLMDEMLHELIGYSIFVSNGEVWKRQRRIIDPALEGARVKEVFQRMADAVEACVARFEAHADRADSTTAPIDVDIEMTHFTADVIFRTIFSEAMTAEGARRIFAAFEVFQHVAYAHGMLRLTNFPVNLLPGSGRARRAAREIREVLKGPIDRRLALVARGEEPPRDILYSLMTTPDPVSGTCFDADELLDQVSMLFLAGHETSAAGLAWTLYLIASCQHIQDRMRDEADRILEDRPPAFGDMKKLELTRDAFREGLRLYPPVPFVGRDATRTERMKTRDVKEGDIVFVAPWLMHRHQKLWAQPDAFDPDRFSSDEARESIRCAYLPFSMGPRVCPGAAFALQEATLVLAELVRRFRISPTPGHAPDPIARLTLRSSNGVPLIVTRR
ncbi:MAG: cytochrome P450 [Caulobacteraceae bacterium]|nr:cytochrome P450 [Caulobacteraceae bacterium]